MPHWSDQFVGQEYVKGENDCAALAAKAVFAATGRTINIPGERANSWRGYTEQILEARDGLAERVTEPRDGDGVLMVGRARLNHIGVLCLIDGRPWILHAMEGAGQVVLHRPHDLERFGLLIEGFYRWK